MSSNTSVALATGQVQSDLEQTSEVVTPSFANSLEVVRKHLLSGDESYPVSAISGHLYGAVVELSAIKNDNDYEIDYITHAGQADNQVDRWKELNEEKQHISLDFARLETYVIRAMMENPTATTLIRQDFMKYVDSSEEESFKKRIGWLRKLDFEARGIKYLRNRNLVVAPLSPYSKDELLYRVAGLSCLVSLEERSYPIIIMAANTSNNYSEYPKNFLDPIELLSLQPLYNAVKKIGFQPSPLVLKEKKLKKYRKLKNFLGSKEVLKINGIKHSNLVSVPTFLFFTS